MGFYQGLQTNHGDEYEFEEENEEMDEDVENEQEESDEDTEEASETETRRPEPVTEVKDIREQMYLEKLNNYRLQLIQVREGTHPEYLKRVKKIEQAYKERLKLNQIWRDLEIEKAEKDFIAEKKAASKDHDEKVGELKENVLLDMEEKRKIIEAERLSMELSGDTTETKPAMTRKLRRRPNDPAPVPEKRRGKINPPSNINYLLDDKDIENDLKAIARGVKSGVSSIRKPSNGLQALGPIIPDSHSPDIRVEDGKLQYNRMWFHRGQTIFVEGKDMPKFPAVISAIGTEAISVKKATDQSKTRIYISQLVKGKISIKRRAS